MTQNSPIWPAQLHHFQLNTGRLEEMVGFYRDGVGLAPQQLDDGRRLMTGGQRRLLLAEGESGDLGFAAFAFEMPDRLDAFRQHVTGQGVNIDGSPSPLFGAEAFSLRDPDGTQLVFGLTPNGDTGGDALPGRLQHFVVASTDMDRLIAFYHDTLGFVLSDWVRTDEGDATACFLRSDPEHHSFAVFRADHCGLDHHAYEVTCWNDIRDWADHFASLYVKLWWGPGRHGPGNNLFFMVEDPDGNKLEISAELEHMPIDMAPREWPHNERSLNYWGQSWMRS